MSASNNRLDMQHGFVKCIIKNQIDRDNYDKEIKAKQTEKTPCKSQNNSKNKKPDIQTYVPPSRKTNSSKTNPDGTKMPVRQLLFKIEYEDEHGQKHEFEVFKGDDPTVLSKRFGKELKLPEILIRSLAERLKEETQMCNSVHLTNAPS
ncbi:unnamed protein product [Owenia fusiformis]|uniref:Uncharacterized protein n=1 Tax=Owenia fusiformis TaxID=6347 RepID=A0A8J1U6X9_OWEFU|nr:unnamed protein product [Owenia fusiformis]